MPDGPQHGSKKQLYVCRWGRQCRLSLKRVSGTPQARCGIDSRQKAPIHDNPHLFAGNDPKGTSADGGDWGREAAN